MIDILKNMSESTKGIVLIVMGLVLMLHTLGVVGIGLNYIIIGISLGMMIYGFTKARTTIMSLFTRLKQ